MSWKNKPSKEDKKFFDDYFGITQKKKDQRWSLLFNNQVICNNVHYPVCVAKRKELINTGNYTNQEYLFEIKRFVK